MSRTAILGLVALALQICLWADRPPLAKTWTGIAVQLLMTTLLFYFAIVLWTR